MVPREGFEPTLPLREADFKLAETRLALYLITPPYLFVDELKSRIRAAYDSDHGPLSEFETYETNGSAEFTIQVRKVESPVPMTYADHIRPGQMRFVTGDLADEVLKYGYHIQHR